MITILLVDDHAVLRAGLAGLLNGQEDMTVIAHVSDGRAGAELAREHRPAVALVDLAMPVIDGIETTRRIRQVAPATRVVILTAFSDRQQILGALDAGAVGYLLKDAEPEEILRGVRAAAADQAPLHPKAAHTVLTRNAPETTRTSDPA